MWQKVFENDAFCGIMHETAAEQKESRSPEAPVDIVILFILMNWSIPTICILRMKVWWYQILNDTFVMWMRRYTLINMAIMAFQHGIKCSINPCLKIYLFQKENYLKIGILCIDLR